jgi:hypothetical protein
MQVQYIWKDSDFLNKEWARRRITSYWVKVDRKDLDSILASVDDPNDLMEDITAHTSSLDDPFYLLVAEDLSSIVCLFHTYPESGQWNGRSPLKEITPVEIETLEDLKTLNLG